MKRTKFAVTGVIAVAACVAGLGATSASADFVPQARDFVGVGSDTTQIAMNAISDGFKSGSLWANGYNATHNARLVSFDAIDPVTGKSGADDPIKLRINSDPIGRPNGSGAGTAQLFNGLEGTATAIDNPSVSFARSSGALSSDDVSHGLVAFPFAVDEVAVAVAAGNGQAVPLSIQDLVKIYNGTWTDWSQVDSSKSGAIVPLVPQSGSGTRKFFEAQLTAAGWNGTYAAGVTARANPTNGDPVIEEHDPSVFTKYPNGIIPMSVGRAGLFETTATLVKFTAVTSKPALGIAGTPHSGGTAFDAKRGVYNIVRGADATKSWALGLFGESGYLCSPAATDGIAAGGLTQLAVDGDGNPSTLDGTCGRPYTTTAGVTDFTTN